MNYITLKDLTEHNPSNLYIGKRNPNSTILFIGICLLSNTILIKFPISLNWNRRKYSNKMQK